jgi:hypothetical protein
MDDDAEFVAIGDFWEPSHPLLLQSVLEAHGIETRLTGEYAGNISGSMGLFGGSRRGGIQLWVRAESEAEARELLVGNADAESEPQPE